MTATVVILTKNQRPYLERSLPAIAAQTGVPGGVEVVVVDGGSTDGAQEVARHYGVHLLDNGSQRFNYARAYNAGAGIGTGRCLVRLSGDAIPIHTDWLARLLAPLEADSTVGVTWGTQRLPPGLRNPIEHLCQRLYGYDKTDAPPRRVTRTRTVLGCNMATRRDLWRQDPFPELLQAEDYAYFHRMIRRGFAGMFVPGAVVLHGHEEPFLRAVHRSFQQSALQVAIRLGIIPRNMPTVRANAQ
ncbi:MAG: glycosyltransferase [Fibrella sp.]|nr:glycosyltransferase [Armatimonadota bacterium]